MDNLFYESNFDGDISEHGQYVRILTLGEDDGSYFLNGAHIYESYYGGHTGFMFLLSEVLSFYNNIKH